MIALITHLPVSKYQGSFSFMRKFTGTRREALLKAMVSVYDTQVTTDSWDLVTSKSRIAKDRKEESVPLS